MGLFRHREKRKDKRAMAWIIYNYGDAEFEFAECSECGYEVNGTEYMKLPGCPKCGRELLTTYRAEEIK